MLEFYKKATATFVGIIGLISLIGYICIDRIFVSDTLLPAQKSVLPWEATTISDAIKGGSSSISVMDAAYSLNYNYTITKNITYPFVSLMLMFADLGYPEQLVDLSGYSTASLRIKCSHRNLLSFELHSFDDKVTMPEDFSSYRISTALFSCGDGWTDVEIDLQHMTVPSWWLQTYNVELSSQNYQLDKVIAFSFGASRQGPVDTPTNVRIGELTLKGRDWRYAYVFLILSALIWCGFIFWLFKSYARALTADVKEKLQKDRPLIAYQQLSIEPHKNKDKGQVLRFMATQYVAPDLTLEMAAAKLGINRTKINEILKQEMGFTFNAYLNKLRLSEAARLLSEKSEASVAEIAYSVGYNNVSYFNRLFKNEYGCTPRTFKNIS